MNSQEPKVVRFPNSGRALPGKAGTPDEKLASEIRSAWRRLWRAIGAARTAGLTVMTKADPNEPPTIERKL